MTMTNPIPFPRPRRQAARLTRAGVLPFGRGDRARAAREQLAGLRAQLDAIAANDRMTPLERDSASKAVLRQVRDRWRYVRAGAAADLEAAKLAARTVADRIREVEAGLSPIDLERLRRRAAALEAGDVHERAAAKQRALDVGDVSELLAHAMVDGGANAKWPLAATIEPQAFKLMVDSAGDAVSTSALAEEVGRALDELLEEGSPWQPAEVRGGELIDFSNQGARAVEGVGQRADQRVAQDVPIAFAGIFRLPTMVRPPVEPQQQEPQQAAGGAA